MGKKSAEAISLPKGGGAQRGIGEKFAPDLQTGTANFTVPIAVPPGRNGFQPQLNLTYTSGNGNGPFGLGWALTVPGIVRKTSHGIPRYRDGLSDLKNWDTFILSGAEDLVPVPEESAANGYHFRPRTEGLFARIEHEVEDVRNYWIAKSQDGLISWYGGLPSPDQDQPATIFDPRAIQHVFAWKLVRTQDPFGNRIEYTYERDLNEDGPRHWNQLYLKQIRYVDYTESNTTKFLVGVTLNYEDRPDSFSEYRSGFEIRTRRRCRDIEVRLEPDGSNQLVRTYAFEYLDASQSEDEVLQNKLSILSQVAVMGHDGDKTESLPPLQFAYSQFRPGAQKFTAVQGADLPPHSLGHPDYELIDLLGNGLPDVLEMNGTVRFWRNRGVGVFDRPKKMEFAPAARLAEVGTQLLDANGDGRVDLLVMQGPLSGYYPLGFGGQWGDFQGYESAPSFNLEDPEVKLIDLTGDGVTDAIRSGTSFECFFNHPQKGWNKPQLFARQALHDFPNVNFSDSRVKWADMTGDGLQDVVLIHSGNIAYWPNLGYGRWGKRIQMKEAPQLPFNYDPKRVLLGDVDGDGCSDLVYIDDGHITLWINQTGNGWSKPISIRGTPSVTNIDSVRLVDLVGSGVSGILWSRDVASFNRHSMYFLDLTGGSKPYLLTQMDNNLGAITKVTYAASTRFFLEDEAAGQAWKTPLPFPVQVVARVDVEDYFPRNKLTTQYTYHHGYWDGAEREFRGFGRVDQRDAEDFQRYDSSPLSPPTLTKTWFHLGPVGEERGEWDELDCSNEYWSDDPGFLDYKENLRQALQEVTKDYHDRRVRRDALRALRGKILRTELYAEDETENDSTRRFRPYTVTEYAYSLREEAKPITEGKDRPHIFFPFVLAQRTTQWERGDDPMTRITFFDAYDDFGHACQQTAVALPRRQARRGQVWGKDVDETRILATHTRTAYAAPASGSTYMHDRVSQVRSFVLANPLSVNEASPADIREVLNDQKAAVRAVLQQFVDLLKDWSPGQALPSELQLITHTIHHYDGDSAQAFKGLDTELGPYGALTRLESLTFTDAHLDKAYGEHRPSYLGGACNVPPGSPPDFGANLGYRREQDSLTGYHAGYYIDAERHKFDFHQPDAVQKRGMVLASQDALGHETATTLDKYWLFPVRVIDPVGLTTEATYDYRVFQPTTVTDSNGNETTYRFTPLGLLASIATPGDKTRPSAQMAYDFMAFKKSSAENRQPIFVHTLRYVHHDTETDVPPTERDRTIETREYSDGFSRLLQTRTQGEEERFGNEVFGGEVLPRDQADDQNTRAEVIGKRPSADKPNVIVSGWQRYDNKGRVVEKYEPFFDVDWEYDQPNDAKLGEKATMFYDPRGNLMRTVNPNGSEQRVILGIPGDLSSPEQFAPTPWETYNYDTNDNAGRTPAGDPRTKDYEHHWNTPASSLMDALGRTLMTVERNRAKPGNPTDLLPPIEEYRTGSAYDIQGNVLSIRDALGRQAFEYAYDLSKQALRTISIDAGWRFTVHDALGNPAETRDEKGAIILRQYDQANRFTHLWASDETNQELTLREQRIYGDTANLAIDQAKEANLLGKLYKHYDEAGLLTFEQYDFKGNVLEKQRQVIKDAAIRARFDPPPPDWQVKAYRVNWNSASRDSDLDVKKYQTSITYDALNRVKTMTYPEDVGGERKVLRPDYNRAGSLERVELNGVEYVKRIAYSAKGQRVLIAYGNGVLTRYAYDPKTFRLARLRSERYTSSDLLKYQLTGTPLQDFGYEKDSEGNITKIKNRILGCGVRNSPQGSDQLDRVFEYDAVYRLTSATGREAATIPQPRPCQDWNGGPSSGYNSPNHGTSTQDNAPDLTALYWERYEYDPAGNMLAMKHGNNEHQQWTRHFGIADSTPKGWREKVAAFLATGSSVPALGGNRLTNHGNEETQAKSHEFDKSGNLTREFGNRHFEWDHSNRLRVFSNQAGTAEPSVHVHYVYDAQGERVMKVVRKQGAEYEVTVYIDGIFEHHRWELTTPSPKQNNYLHVMDNKSRIAFIRLGEKRSDDPGPSIQFHLGDHLGSSNVVIDETGNWINREELFPYGETSFGTFAKKRYRFTNKERDEESGLYYHGARYYVAWLARWQSCDPASNVDGLNIYSYCRNNPSRFIDNDGRFLSEPSSVAPAVVKSGVGGAAAAPFIAAGAAAVSVGAFIYNTHKAVKTQKEIERHADKSRMAQQHVDKQIETFWKNGLLTDKEFLLSKISSRVIFLGEGMGYEGPMPQSLPSRTASTETGRARFLDFAQKSFASNFSLTPSLKTLWENTGKNLADTRYAFDTHVKRFWTAVNSSSDPDAQMVRSILETAGYELQGGSKAPLLNLRTGDSRLTREISDRRLTIDHRDPLSINVAGIHSSDNVRFMSGRDNSARGNRFDMNDQPVGPK